MSGLALTKTTLDVRPRAAVRQSHILSECNARFVPSYGGDSAAIEFDYSVIRHVYSTEIIETKMEMNFSG